MALRKLSHFPSAYIGIVEEVGGKRKEIRVACENEKQALRLRNRFYVFRNALRHELADDTTLRLAEMVVVAVDGNTVVFINRETTPEAKLLEEGLAKARKDEEDGQEA